MEYYPSDSKIGRPWSALVGKFEQAFLYPNTISVFNSNPVFLQYLPLESRIFWIREKVNMLPEFSSHRNLDAEKLLEVTDEDCHSQDTFFGEFRDSHTTWAQKAANLMFRKSVPNWALFSTIFIITLLSSAIPALSLRNYPSRSFVYCKFHKLWQLTIHANTTEAPANSALEYKLVAPKADMAYYPPFTDESDKLWGRWEDSKKQLYADRDYTHIRQSYHQWERMRLQKWIRRRGNFVGESMFLCWMFFTNCTVW